MRVVIQRVTRASVSIGGQAYSSIGRGLLVFLGITAGDTPADAGWLSGKIAALRIFDDAGGVMNLDVRQAEGEILVVSQFTLYASTKKGNRPSYVRAAKEDMAVPLYGIFLRELSVALGGNVKHGQFGADMAVELVNDGPVTICMDSQARE